MNPNPAPISDEELSAVLDGEADQATVDRVAADPAASARLASFRSVAAGVRSEPVRALDPQTIDILVARAIDEGMGAVPSEGAAPGTGAVVTPMPAPRRSTRMPPWLVAAAVIVFVAVGLGLLFAGTRTTGGQDQASTSADQRSAAPDADRTTAGERGSASDGATPPAPTVPSSPAFPEAPPSTSPGEGSFDRPLIDLGTFADTDALRTALADTFPTGPTVAAEASVPTVDQINRCSLLMKQIFSLKAEPRSTGVATVGGTQLIVFEFDAPSGADGRPTTFITANDADSCKAFLSFERDPG